MTCMYLYEIHNLLEVIFYFFIFRVIGITGNVHPEQIAEFVQHGADAVVSKPLTKAKLMAALASP